MTFVTRAAIVTLPMTRVLKCGFRFRKLKPFGTIALDVEEFPPNEFTTEVIHNNFDFVGSGISPLSMRVPARLTRSPQDRAIRE